MSVQAQVLRLQTARDNIVSAIADKGVSVPFGTKIDDIAALIATMETGGGLPDGISALATGTFTPTSDITAAHTITHDMGVVPSFALLMLCDDAATTNLKSMRMFQAQFYKNIRNYSDKLDIMRGCTLYMSSTGSAASSTSTATHSFTGGANATNVTFTASSTGPLKAGYTYCWVCGVLDAIL